MAKQAEQARLDEQARQAEQAKQDRLVEQARQARQAAPFDEGRLGTADGLAGKAKRAAVGFAKAVGFVKDSQD